MEHHLTAYSHSFLWQIGNTCLSCLHRLKIYLRNAVSDKRLSGLSLINICINISVLLTLLIKLYEMYWYISLYSHSFDWNKELNWIGKSPVGQSYTVQSKFSTMSEIHREFELHATSVWVSIGNEWLPLWCLLFVVSSGKGGLRRFVFSPKSGLCGLNLFYTYTCTL